jgi:sigma-E factor negative regulatory protein RseA
VKNKVSELMDGELDTKEAAALITELKGKEDLYDNWKAYHLIGDTLRDSSKLSVDISQSVSNQLRTEPAILVTYAPKYIPTPFRRKMVGLSIAASLVIMVTGWLSMHALQQPQQIQVADNANLENMAPPIRVLNHSSPHKYAHSFEPDEIEDYLYVHGEFSPGTATRGLASRYVRSVNVTRDQ